MNFITSILCLSSLVCVAVARPEREPLSLPIPYNVRLNGLDAGWSVTIQGEVPSRAVNFTLDFECLPTSDIAFHFKPYFNTPEVVRNHRLNDVWGSEEQSGTNPLRRSQSFELKVAVEKNGFKVYIDDKFFCFYEHRIPFHRITNVKIYFDIILTTVTVKEGENGPTSIDVV